VDTRSPEFDATTADFSHRAPAEDRLEHGPFLLEALRTRELTQRYAPAAPATTGGPRPGYLSNAHMKHMTHPTHLAVA